MSSVSTFDGKFLKNFSNYIEFVFEHFFNARILMQKIKAQVLRNLNTFLIYSSLKRRYLVENFKYINNQTTSLFDSLFQSITYIFSALKKIFKNERKLKHF